MNTLADDVKPDEIRDLTNDIVSSANRLMKITENFLMYVRIESFFNNPQKRQQLKLYRTFEPSAMMADIASFVAQKYNRLDDLIVNTDSDEISIEISTESFHKVIDELVDNAFRFSHPKER